MRMPTCSTLGRVCFGLALAASGLMQLVNREFVRLVPPLPGWLPAPSLWVLVTGALLVAVGFALVTDRARRAAAGTVIALLLVSFVFQRVPEILANPGAGFIWTNPLKVLALAGGALVWARPDRLGVTGAAALLGTFLVVCGVQHVVYAGFVDTLVPGWLPPGRRFWTLFAAAALVAGGTGLAVPRLRVAAGRCAGVMILLWVPLVHGARTLETRSAFELAGVFEALGIAGVAWLVAGAAAVPPASARNTSA